jgi:xylan 1,4-beta-xylosidase
MPRNHNLFAGLLGALAWGAAANSFAAEPLPPIRVSDNGRCFVKADGTPFFWLGDTAWSIFNHPAPADVDLYLEDRAAKGFTVIQGCLVLWDGLRRPNPDGQLPFVDGNPGKINEAFFTNVDAIVAKAEARGLYMAILPCWAKAFVPNRDRYAGTMLHPELMKGYCQYLGRRYGKRNIFWVLGGDWPGKDTIELSNAMAAGLIEGAGTNQLLITYHPTGRQSSSFWFQNSPWLSFNAIQSGHFIRTTNFKLIADDVVKTPPKPTLDIEPAYENITDGLVRNNPDARRISADDVRRSAYLAVFAGAAGHTYGCGEVYEFWSPETRGSLPGWGAGLPWRESLKLPGSGQVRYLRYLIESRPMLGRIPDQSLIAGEDLPVLDRVQVTRAADGSYAFVYTASGKPFRLDISRLSRMELVAWWYDPHTGEAKQFDRFTNVATHEFTPPSSGVGHDWVLVLDDASKNFPAPGRIPERPTLPPTTRKGGISGPGKPFLLGDRFTVHRRPTSNSAVKAGLLPPIRPLLDLLIRDTVICLGGDGNYYLTGSTGDDIWVFNDGVELWRSPDLKKWEYLGLVWTLAKDATWEKAPRDLHGKPTVTIWAPEIHYLKKLNTYVIVLSMAPGGISLLKSITGKPEGPYVNTVRGGKPLRSGGIDPTLFEDDDGKVYFTSGAGGTISLLKDDLTGFAETRAVKLLNPDHNPAHHAEKVVRRGMNGFGHEGAVLFKANGTYYHGAVDNYEGRYSSCVAIADNIWGPYDHWHETVPCGGGTNFFQDKEGNWWCVFFGNDDAAPWRELPGIVRVEFAKDGNISVAKHQPDFILQNSTPSTKP